MDLKAYIRDVPDFPVPGILFRDITPLLRDASAFGHALDLMTDAVRALRAEAVAGIESRGFIFASAIASREGLPFVPIRKPGKLPAARMTVEYSLEYGNSQLDIHADGVAAGEQVVIVDDLIATAGTARAAAKLVELAGGRVAGMVFLIELAGLEGRAQLAEYEIRSFVVYD
jgi:adenine phosphoribosyltransferase